MIKLKNQFIFIFFFFSFHVISFGQTYFDSLENVLSSLPEDTNRVIFLSNLSQDISTSSPEKAEQYALEAIALGKKLGFKKGIAKGYTTLAISFYVRGDYTLHFENLQKALDIYTDMDDQIGTGKILNNLGASFQARGNYQESLKYYFNALEIFEEKGVDISVAKVLNNIGEIYEMLDEPDPALDHYNKSFEIFNSKEGFEWEKAYMLLNIGRIHFKKRNLSSALKYYKQSLYIFMDFDEKYYVADCYKNIGEIYFSQKSFNKALDYFNKSLKIKEEIEDKQGVAECYLSIGITYGVLKNALLSNSFYNKSLDIAQEIGAKEIEMKAFQNLSDQEITLGDYAAALDYFKKHTVLKDSVMGFETRKKLAELQTEYETEKKEQENLRLLSENELQKQTIQKQLYAGILVAVFLLSVIILAIVFFKGQQRQRKVNLLLEQKEEVLEKQAKKLAEANVKLQELDRLKSMFIATMSHELRTPLNSIIGFSGVMLMGMTGELSQEQREQLTMVKSSANHLLALVNDIIDLSKIEASKVELLITQFDFSIVVKEVKKSFKVTVDEKGLNMPLKVPEGIVVKSDERRVKQIIVNLIGNAVKFTDEGEVAIRVVKKDGMVEVAVQDTGPGIEKENMDWLFKAFSQVPSGGVQKEGTGLGLHLSQRIADLLGGEISAESEFGKGSTFTLSFPSEYEEIRT